MTRAKKQKLAGSKKKEYVINAGQKCNEDWDNWSFQEFLNFFYNHYTSIAGYVTSMSINLLNDFEI